MAATDRNVTIDPTTGHRIDPLTGIDIDQAVTDGDNVALTRVEIAQYEHMLTDEYPDSWYVQHCLKLARGRLTKYLAGPSVSPQSNGCR